MPPRIHSLEETIYSIIDQVDEINIYLNNFEGMPLPAFLQQPKINCFYSEAHLGDLGAAGKFFLCSSWSGYAFTGDDDIIYPKDYIQSMIQTIEKYDRRAIISCHGRVLHTNRESISYYFDAKEFFSFQKDVYNDTYAHVIGTGVMAMHSDTIRLSLSDFKYTNICDIFFSARANTLGIPRIIKAHKELWLRPSKKYNPEYSISRTQSKSDTIQTAEINAHKWTLNQIQ